MQKLLKESGLAIVWGCLGLLIASMLNFPAPFLTGPALVVTLACLFGFPAQYSSYSTGCLFYCYWNRNGDICNS